MKKPVSLAALCLAAALPLWPSSTMRLDFAQLSRQADQVVAGKIIGIATEADPATGYIYSRVSLSAAGAIPGVPSAKPFEFRMLGGEYGGRKLWISGFPELRPGQEVVLFLARETSAIFGPTVGLWQGVYFVERDGPLGADRVLDHMLRPVLGVRGGNIILGLRAAGAAKFPQPAESAPLGVQQFLRQVLAARSAATRIGTPPRN